MKGEEWIELPECSNYEISNRGRLRRKRSKVRRFHKWVEVGGKVLDLKGSNGMTLYNSKNGQKVHVHVARRVAELFGDSDVDA